MRPGYSFDAVVARSELIVVAHVEEDSIQRISHDHWWEHTATLLIREVLKGDCSETAIPVTIHYGMDPFIGSALTGRSPTPAERGGRRGDPRDAIQILDTGSSASSSTPVIADARDDNLWFLRKRSGIYGEEPGTGNYGVVDLEDLGPTNEKELVLAYLSDDPRRAVREVVQKYSGGDGGDDQTYYHLQVARLLALKDPEERFWQLSPYFLHPISTAIGSQAREGVVSGGTLAGTALRDYFPGVSAALRLEILRIWRLLGYREVTPLLVDLLQQHEQFWTGEHLQRDWWDETANPVQTGRRRDICTEDLEAVRVLRSFNDARARGALVATRARWTAAGSDPLGIAKECEAALRELGP